jgi:hypothetical protein
MATIWQKKFPRLALADTFRYGLWKREYREILTRWP